MIGFPHNQHNVNFVGGGATTVVLAHGFGSNQAAWHQILPWFAARHRVMLFDLAGSTASNAAFYTVTQHDRLEDYARDLVTLLDRYGIRRCIYVGHGVSGMIGLLAGIERPELFQRMVMLGASPCHLNDGAYAGGLERRELDAMFSAMARDYRGWVDMFAPAMAGGLQFKAAVQDYTASLLELPPPIAVSAARTIFQADLRLRLHEARVPALLVQTQSDPLVPMPVAEYLETHVPHSRLALLNAEGHLPHMTAPERVVQLLETHNIGQAAAA